MSLRKRLQPLYTQILTSNQRLQKRRHQFEKRRQRRGEAHVVEVYLHLDDPYSHLLVQVLPAFARRFDIQIRPRMILNLQPDMFPDSRRLKDWSNTDAGYLAELYELTVLTLSGESEYLHSASQQASHISELAELQQAFSDYAQGKSPEVDQSTSGAEQIRANEDRLRSKGHYLPATLFYGGEWYWGLDRINHLEQRLIALGLSKDNQQQPFFQRRLSFLEQYPDQSVSTTRGEIEIFWSARSPYSYLALEQCVRLAEHHQVQLNIRPVLPMVMRRLKVPKSKRLYILADTKREADLLGIPFGKICDPLGSAVERCYAVMAKLASNERQNRFALAFARCIWSQGIDGATDRGLKQIADTAGIDWSEIQPALAGDEWRTTVEQNRLEMMESGFWGVPVIRYRDTMVWGQDRLWLIHSRLSEPEG